MFIGTALPGSSSAATPIGRHLLLSRGLWTYFELRRYSLRTAAV
jgi:hypothetical protein